MTEKINSKRNYRLTLFNFIKALVWIMVIGLLFYSRFVNLGWGLPNPMHPDERNMVNAIQQLDCQPPKFTLNLPHDLTGNWPPVTEWISLGNFDFQNCFNPHFFAYGQLPLYLGLVLVYFIKFLKQGFGLPIGFEEAALSLRIIAALSTIVNVYILVKIVGRIIKPSVTNQNLLIVLITALSPFFVQSAHFGTTEALLMLFYSVIVYLAVSFTDHKTSELSYVTGSAFFVGLAMATKISSGIFLMVPFMVLLFDTNFLKKKTSITKSNQSSHFFFYKLVSKIIDLIILIWLSLVIFVIFSPHNLINYNDFFTSINYESDVALGRSLVFYTKQFFGTIPAMFQLIKVFPYTLGWPVFLMGLIGFIGANWKNKKINVLRFAFLTYFVPSALIYAKWSRFMAPVLPLMLIFALLALLKSKDILLNNNWINSKFEIQNSKFQVNNQKFYTFYFLISFLTFALLLLTCIIPGLAYLSVYTSQDVRLKASEWIYKNIPNNSYILSETANVVDIPISNGLPEQLKNYNVISFNFYDLDANQELQNQLIYHLEKADYIFIPSRRIFANYTCEKNFQFPISDFQLNDKCQILKKTYPQLNKYYGDLFSGRLGFEEVAEFDSYPTIKYQILNFKIQIKFPDEGAEETWTVFDHPVIRIYKKVKP